MRYDLADLIRIGQVEVDVSTAETWLTTYIDSAANRASDQPYAYPAYDRYDAGSREPGTLTDADLLAPGLLNVQVKLRSFYGLQRVRGRLEEGLRSPALAGALGRTPFQEVAPAVRALYGVLDDPDLRPWGVEGTTLSKILHRKRPQSLILHDQWVRRCYVGDDAPVPLARSRSWADYMVLLTKAIRTNIATQPRAFTRLRQVTAGKLSDVRLLDLLAWTSKGGTPGDELEDLTDETSPDLHG